MRTIDGVEEWARDDAHDKRDGGTWNSWCESFVFRAGGFTGSFESAMLAGDASGYLDPDWRTAQRGEIHYWAGVGGNGHVAYELGGGLLLMASASVTDRWGDAMGTIPFRLYALKGIPYRGHTFRHGSQRLATTGTAGGGAIPVPKPPEEADMLHVITSQHGIFNVSLGHVVSEDDAFYALVRDGWLGPWKEIQVTDDPTGDKLRGQLFRLAGFRDAQVPSPGYAWHAFPAPSVVNVGGDEAEPLDYQKLAGLVAQDLAARLAS